MPKYENTVAMTKMLSMPSDLSTTYP